MSDVIEELRVKVDALWMGHAITGDDHAYLHEQIGSLLAAQQPARPVETITLQMYAILKTKLANAEEEIERMKEQQAKVPDGYSVVPTFILNRMKRAVDDAERMATEGMHVSGAKVAVPITDIKSMLQAASNAQSAREGKV